MDSSDGNDMICINSLNSYINITEEIPVVVDYTVDITIEAFTANLLSTINKLYETTDFFKHDIEEKNLLIKALHFTEANDDNKFDRELLDETNNTLSEQVETTLSLESSYSSNLNSSINYISLTHATNDTVNGIDNRHQSIYLESKRYSNKRNALGEIHQAIMSDNVSNQEVTKYVLRNISISKSQREYLYTNGDQLLNKIDHL